MISNLEVTIVTLMCQDHVGYKDHMSTNEDHMSSEDHIVMGGTFAGVGDFSAVSAMAVSRDHYSNLIKDESACIR